MIFGLIGLFLRRASAPSLGQRYLSDSAGWLYLFHPPVLVLIQTPMTALPLPAELKAVPGIVRAVPILLRTYDRWVRPTWLGVILNGRRCPRGLPEAVPAALVPQPVLATDSTQA